MGIKLAPFNFMFEFIGNILRICRHCGSIPEYGSIFCSVCRTTYKREMFGKWNSDCELRSLFLFNSKGKHYRDLLHLKDHSSPKFESYLVQGLVEKRLQLMPKLPVDPVVIPAPSSTGRTHAQRLAKSLCHHSGWDYQDVLRKESVLQKKKSRAERQSAEVQALNQFPGRSVILIDDLITTGSTARACEKGLKGLKSFEVWTPYRTVLLLEGKDTDITHADEKTGISNFYNRLFTDDLR